MSIQILPFLYSDIQDVKSFCDRCIGVDYFSLKELQELQRRSEYKQLNASFVLRVDDVVRGIRITLPPGCWQFGKSNKLSEEEWPHKKEFTAYFQSQFIDPNYMRQGYASLMVNKSIEVLKKLKAKGIVCHAWVESPNDSSRKYLQSLGFKEISLYKNYWFEVDYQCVRCGKPCVCSAQEMYLDLEAK